MARTQHETDEQCRERRGGGGKKAHRTLSGARVTCAGRGRNGLVFALLSSFVANKDVDDELRWLSQGNGAVPHGHPRSQREEVVRGPPAGLRARLPGARGGVRG